VNARRGPETYDVDADPPYTRRRPVLRRKESDSCTPQVHRGKDDGMYRRNAPEAREAEKDGGGRRDEQPARVRLGPPRWRRGS
jgi:hypothetical protein